MFEDADKTSADIIANAFQKRAWHGPLFLLFWVQQKFNYIAKSWILILYDKTRRNGKGAYFQYFSPRREMTKNASLRTHNPEVVGSNPSPATTLVHRLWYNSLCTFMRFCPGKPLIQGQSETSGCNHASSCLAFLLCQFFSWVGAILNLHPPSYTLWRFSRFAKRFPKKLHFWQCNQYLLGIWLICGSPIHKKSDLSLCQLISIRIMLWKLCPCSIWEFQNSCFVPDNPVLNTASKNT